MSKYQQVTYIVDTTCKAGFTLFANAFIAQLYEFIHIKKDGFIIICLAMYRPELKNFQILFLKNKKIYLYITKFIFDHVNRKMSSIIYSKDLWLKNSHLSLEKSLNFFFFILDQLYFDQALFICSMLRTCTSSSTKKFLGYSTNLAHDKTSNNQNKIVLYWENLNQFFLLNEPENFWQNCYLIVFIALCLMYYI